MGRWLGLLLLVVGVVLGWGYPVQAATKMPPVEAASAPLGEGREDSASSPPAQPDANDIPSETVSRFVQTYLSVVKLIESREMSLQQAETDTESQQMQQEIQTAAIDLIQANGLTLQAYWELLGLANSDPEFRERVLAQVEEVGL